MLFFYQYCIAPIFSVVPIFRLLLGKDSKAQARNRFGNASEHRKGPVIWLHGASVGELQSVKLFLAYLNQHFPQYQILVTANNPTALELAGSWDNISVTLQVAPLDTDGALRRFLDSWLPDAFINVEGEIWPNRLLQLSLRNIPVVFVNARLSEKSARRLGWLGLGAPTLEKVSAFFCQDIGSAKSFAGLGVARERIEVIQNLKSRPSKAGLQIDQMPVQQVFLRDKTILAASTHKGEDAIILAAFVQAKRTIPDLKLIIAPRHPKRGDAVATLISAAGLEYARRSFGQEITGQIQVYLADTLGEMDLFYQMSAITFVAGSLVPKRGHTPYEPARFGSAIISGPYVENFAAEYQTLEAAGGCLRVKGSASLAEAILALCVKGDRDLQVEKALQALSVGGDPSELFEHMLAPLALTEGGCE